MDIISLEQSLRLLRTLLISLDNNPQHDTLLLILIEKSIISSGTLKSISSLLISLLVKLLSLGFFALKHGVISFASINLSVAEDQSSFNRTIGVSRLISEGTIILF